MLTIQREHTAQGHAICRPVGDLDAFTVSQFRQALAELTKGVQVIIDLSGIPFMDSARLGALIGGIRGIRELGGDVAVACNRPTLLRLLHSTGFDRIVTLAPTATEAAAALKDFEPERPNPPIMVDRVDDDRTV
jgi:anti-sigma B factor antagonist